jgi:hypothetical protein
MKAILGIGRLINLQLVDPTTGKQSTRRTPGKWLGWDTRARQFLICTVRGRSASSLPADVVRAHKRFHQAAPNGRARLVEAPSPIGAQRQIALIKALSYFVPKSVISPGKNPYGWHHAFGDTGHKGGTYTAKVMPALVRDSRGNLFIKRRKGNIFTVDTWLRG